MDKINLYHTRTTYNLHRLEYFVAMLVCIYLVLSHYDSVNWILFVALFAYIDLIGYIPGLIAYKLSPERKVKRIFYILYNTAHHMVTAALVLSMVYLIYGFDWALLAVPIHLCGDRGLLGNFFKPFSDSFEAEPNKEYDRFAEQIKEINACSH